MLGSQSYPTRRTPEFANTRASPSPLISALANPLRTETVRAPTFSLCQPTVDSLYRWQSGEGPPRSHKTTIMFLENHGLALGLILLLVVSACALLLARKAARQVEEFREEHHQRFTGGTPE